MSVNRKPTPFLNTNIWNIHREFIRVCGFDGFPRYHMTPLEIGTHMRRCLSFHCLGVYGPPENLSTPPRQAQGSSQFDAMLPPWQPADPTAMQSRHIPSFTGGRSQRTRRSWPQLSGSVLAMAQTNPDMRCMRSTPLAMCSSCQPGEKCAFRCFARRSELNQQMNEQIGRQEMTFSGWCRPFCNLFFWLIFTRICISLWFVLFEFSQR